MNIYTGGNLWASPSAGLPPLANPALAHDPDFSRVLALGQGALSISAGLPSRFRKTVQTFLARFMSLPNPDAKDIQFAGEKLQAAMDICTALRAQFIARGMTNQNVSAGYYGSDDYDPLGPSGTRFDGADPLQRSLEAGFDAQVIAGYQSIVGLLGVLGVDKIRPAAPNADAVDSLQSLIDRSFSP